MPSSISEALSRITELFEKHSISYMLIGGYALAYLGRIRATIDIDIAVVAKSEEVNDLTNILTENRYNVSFGDPRNPCFMIFDEDSGNEIEIWHDLDGVKIDAEVLRRRLLVTTPTGLKLRIIGPENFIVNKLARPDRGAVDEEDVASVLEEQRKNLDYDYLYEQAKKVDVLNLLKTIQKRIKLDI